MREIPKKREIPIKSPKKTCYKYCLTGEAVQSASCAIIWGYQFELPKCNRDNRSKAPYKIVKQEYLVNSWISLLVGTIGGTLGMFVGFSLIGTFDWANGFVRSSILAQLKRRVQKVSKQGTQQVQVEAP